MRTRRLQRWAMRLLTSLHCYLCYALPLLGSSLHASAATDCSLLEGKYSNSGTQIDILNPREDHALMSDRTRFAQSGTAYFSFTVFEGAHGYTIRLFDLDGIELHKVSSGGPAFRCEDGRLERVVTSFGSGDGNPTKITSETYIYKEDDELVIVTKRRTESIRLIAPSEPTLIHNKARFRGIGR